MRRIVTPQAKAMVTLRLDPDVLAWFEQGAAAAIKPASMRCCERSWRLTGHQRGAEGASAI